MSDHDRDHDPFDSAWRALWPVATEDAAAPGVPARRRPAPPALRMAPTRAPAPAVASAFDETIPTLTEIVPTPLDAGDELPRTLDEVDWSGLALQVREQVLDALLRQPERFLDEPLRERLQRVVARATKALTLEIRTSVDEAVRDAVAHAVAEELMRVQAEILDRGQATRVPDPNGLL